MHRLHLAPLFAALLTPAACGDRPAAAGPVVITQSMKEVFAPNSADLLDVVIDAMDDQAQLDPDRLLGSDWAAMAVSVAALRDGTIALRDRPLQVVAAPGEKLEGEGNPGVLTAAEVQSRIDATPQDFRLYAGALLADLERMADAIQAHDAATLGEVALELDARCIACHGKYWYADEGALPAP